MIVTLTLNPAVDVSTNVDRLVPTHKLHCAQPQYDAGGGGINVSKAIHRLGGHSLALFTAGGPNGLTLQKLVDTEALSYQLIHIDGMTRESFVVTETSTNLQFRFGTPGPEITPMEAESCLTALSKLPASTDYLVISGSLPPGLPTDFYGLITRQAKAQGIKVIIDTSGKPLQSALQCGVFLTKPNLGELARLVGKERLEGKQVSLAARELIQARWCEVVVVSLGPRGALLVTNDLHEYIPAPIVKTISTVGAGDSLVGGMVYALGQGKSLSEAARLGVACGTAATQNSGTHLFQKQEADELLAWINQQSGSVNEW
ncbi:1-phosphofructokinase family hexose kinase [Spirosoma sp. SC4-14]|uniref:1-phosphofructokinase family hexose kinase n=1 Tax=Spirosoma sp. SC4-14 TaxID=3128900 RepID=UPI0030D42640